MPAPTSTVPVGKASYATNRSKISTTVTPSPNVGGKPALDSRERHPLKKPVIKTSDIAPNGQLDPEGLVRVLGLILDHVGDATAPARTDPLGVKCILQSVAVTSGKQIDLKHTLGEPWRYAFILRAAAGSPACSLAAVASPPLDQGQYASVIPSASGTYDICICAG